MHPCVRTYKHVARFERSGHPCPRYFHSNIHPTCISSYSSVQDTIFMRSGSDRERTFVYRAITNGWSHRIIGRTVNMNFVLMRAGCASNVSCWGEIFLWPNIGCANAGYPKNSANNSKTFLWIWTRCSSSSLQSDQKTFMYCSSGSLQDVLKLAMPSSIA